MWNENKGWILGTLIGSVLGSITLHGVIEPWLKSRHQVPALSQEEAQKVAKDVIEHGAPTIQEVIGMCSRKESQDGIIKIYNRSGLKIAEILVDKSNGDAMLMIYTHGGEMNAHSEYKDKESAIKAFEKKQSNVVDTSISCSE